ncbi:bifunctional diaminohydroxyphosphoribosylaminopyrimidine deaminase/5-amino-6-(5-phosphoribosylamino)uracil reductase RibD [Alteribacillus iranensis]|uniref:Riboflavin biosynthesis protein RibD n=1 Tax=Alteribacillus iranensis TaxID=930128 RepID=A0A1I1ZLC0_9BACI|nr:bifunctional diaminohydroxyphosphoribosylaminopyrimidine deaminase/5-amino-6-(5-phosphoribosylamino)uracil reductase RibD [Alteribacillus iranensis]SFE32501.1 diaminohydroxyphosphoribosylaminopyrimidine deaminase /5-amino-6-(5-phosphoribosylamino)uracil reductase [Alteribacillus iranensis]
MTDEEYMELALQVAQATKGQTSPNPVVGAAVVKNGRLLGVAAHLKAGEAHAEVNALTMAGEEAKGATIYVTLEPCSHYGKTPPCADLIIEKQIKRAVVATKDPNPEVAGNGIKKLEEAGIEVTFGVLKDEADWLNRHFFHYINTGLPYVTLKTASSLDGKTATTLKESQWITGPDAREDGHRLRHQNDAILVGSGTVLSDDPSLTVRLPNGGLSPCRVILDTHLKTSPEAKMLEDHQAPVWIICGKDADQEKREALRYKGAVILPTSRTHIDIHEVLSILGEKGITSLYVEGGSSVHGSFLEEKAFQEIVCYVAPKLIGGVNAPPVIGGEGFAHMEDTVDLEIVSTEHVGKDLKITALPRKKERYTCLQE